MAVRKTPIQTIVETALWREKIRLKAEARSRRRPSAPLRIPSSAKRHHALLWKIAQDFPNGLIVGFQGFPPYTPDMRALVRKGLLKYGRTHRHTAGNRAPTGVNIVWLTSEGIELLKNDKPDHFSVLYIEDAFNASTVR